MNPSKHPDAAAAYDQAVIGIVGEDNTQQG